VSSLVFYIVLSGHQARRCNEKSVQSIIMWKGGADCGGLRSEDVCILALTRKRRNVQAANIPWREAYPRIPNCATLQR